MKRYEILHSELPIRSIHHAKPSIQSNIQLPIVETLSKEGLAEMSQLQLMRQATLQHEKDDL